MDEFTTPKTLKQNLEKKDLFYKNSPVVDDHFFERKLKLLLDKELLNPREQVILEIMRSSKRIL